MSTKPLKPNKVSKHNLSVIPTAYEETEKIISNKIISDNVYERIKVMEAQRRARDEEAILEIINQNSHKNPLVKMAEIRNNTFQNAIGCLFGIRNTEAFETMMILFEYMEKNKSYKIDKLTGTELLKFGRSKSINQEKRHKKLKLLVGQSSIKIQVLDPEESTKNYQNKKLNKGLVYKLFDLLKIDQITYSKINPNMIVKLSGVELFPGYINNINIISRRYLPLESIRRVPEERGGSKSRYFLYKLCFKFASNKKTFINLTLDECMNLGRFYNRRDRNLRKKWGAIEKALQEGVKIGLIKYKWILTTLAHKDKGLFETNLLGEIISPKFTEDGKLIGEYYKHIDSVKIQRLYDLESSKEFPFELEDDSFAQSFKGSIIQL